MNATATTVRNGARPKASGKRFLIAFDPYLFAGCSKGSASYFMLMSGPLLAGNKRLIQSSAFLYCIGEK